MREARDLLHGPPHGYPDTCHGLGALSEEHERLDAALDHLAAVNPGGDAVEHGAGEAAGTCLGGGVAVGPRAVLDAAAVVPRRGGNTR
ncbi:hypothetical protein [Streptomyces sp. NPDC001070]